MWFIERQIVVAYVNALFILYGTSSRVSYCTFFRILLAEPPIRVIALKLLLIAACQGRPVAWSREL